MAQLAIQGHPTRGSEVVALLKMLGGYQCGYPKEARTGYWFMDRCNNINAYDAAPTDLYDDFTVFTLEEFEAKFPYKIGDRVKTVYGKIGIVNKPIWSNRDNCIRYELKADTDSFYFVNELQPYKEETMEDKPNLLQQLKEYFDNTPREVVEKEWHDYDKYNEISPKVNEYLEYVNNIRQPKYPKTYVECAKILDCFSAAYIDGYKNELLEKLQELLICRDAYWEIAGEELGLGKPWEPDWSNGDETKFCLYTTQNIISLDIFGVDNRILAFPTEEMRDAFYENFKDLIEKCKEFL